MSSKKVFVAAISFLCLVGTATLIAAEKPRKLTCCEEAYSKKKECSHKCCVLAHNRGETCSKCNPGKEDLKALKDSKTAKKSGAQTAR